MRPTRATSTWGLILAGCLSLSSPAANAQESPSAAASRRPAEPQPDRVARLERRVEELSRDNARLTRERDAAIAKRKEAERRVRDLERRTDRPQVRIVPTPTPPLQLRPMPEPVPENWSPRQFNGITYYVIPLGQRQGRPAAPGR